MEEKNTIKLSICITTLNRSTFLAETLGNIISQANDNTEIVIVDGASTDNTKEVVQKYQQKFKNLVYYREEKNEGVDRDMGKAIEYSRGEYCWLFSDDDMIKPGALKRILKEIESKHEIYLCNITACDLAMKPYKDEFLLRREIKDRVYGLHEKNEFIEYCNSALRLCALFSYWGSFIFRRKEWLKTGYDYDFDRSAYASAASLLSFIKRKCTLKYIREPLVLWRNDNVSFQHAGGLVKRFLLDFDGYLKLADKFLDDIEMKEALLKVMMREHPWYTIINVASFIDNQKQWSQFREKMLKFGYSPRIADICYALGRYKNLVAAAVGVKRRIIRTGWVDRVTGLLKG